MNQPAVRVFPMLRSRWVWVLFVCTTAYVFVFMGCASFQRRMIYFPTVCSTEEAAQLGRNERLEPWVNPAGEPIGWKRLHSTGHTQGKVLILHGNGGCAVYCGHYADVIQEAAPLDVFIVEYPGYANCAGKPSEPALEQAAARALETLPNDGPIYLAGESLGTGAAAWLAGRYPTRVAGMVLLAPYDCLTSVAQAHVRIFPVRWILCDTFPAEEYLRSYHGPVAVLVGGRDTVVPERFGRRLYDSYAGPKRLWQFPDATHGSLMVQPPETWKQIVAFWQSAGRT
jgi:uncharacterized protein